MNNKNAIVFSVHFDTFVNDDGYARMSSFRMFIQLLECIKSIRKFSNVKIIIFYSPYAIFNGIKQYFKKLNVDLVEFNNDNIYKPWMDDIEYPSFNRYLHHRWINLIKSFELFDINKVLYLDTDVLFYQNPDLIFEKYNKDICYMIEGELNFDIITNTSHISDFPGTNDGFILLSKTEINKIKDNFESIWIEKIQFINNIVYNDLKNAPDGNHGSIYGNFIWNISQYAAYLIIKDNLIYEPLDRTEIVLSGEYDTADKNKVIGHHYYSALTDKYLFGIEEEND